MQRLPDLATTHRVLFQFRGAGQVRRSYPRHPVLRTRTNEAARLIAHSRVVWFRRQGSGHTFNANEWHPSHGFNGNTDGGRTHNSTEYRQT